MMCTGNICRSPLAAILLEDRLSDATVSVSSVGTRARDGALMDKESLRQGELRGVSVERMTAHRAKRVTQSDLSQADLILGMTREHRREAAELSPSSIRKTFTLRELSHILRYLSDEDLFAASDIAPDDDRQRRFATILWSVSQQRGVITPPPDPEKYDIIDPYNRSGTVHERAAVEIDAGLDAVERLIKLSAR